MTTEYDWSALVFGGTWISRFEAVARQRFGQTAIADEAVNYVIDQLSAEEWIKLKGYQGKAKPMSYLNAVAGNLLEEFSRRKFGRPRPPEWLKRKGNLWVTIWKQLCLDRKAENHVIELWLSAERTYEYLFDIARVIKAKLPWCGVKHEEIPASFLQNEESDDISRYLEPEDSLDSEATAEAHYLEETLLVIRLFFNSEYDDLPQDAVSELKQKLNDLRKAVDLAAEEQLMIKMVFLERMPQNQVAEALGLAPYQLSRRLKSAMKTLRAALGRAGFDEVRLRETLQC